MAVFRWPTKPAAGRFPTSPEQMAGNPDIDDDEFFTNPWHTGGGMEADDAAKDPQSSQPDLTGSALDSGASAYGQNAADRWQGTASVGLSMFSRRTPVFGVSNGRGGRLIERKRLDASTRMANPPRGLIGGRALENMQTYGQDSAYTPKQEWDALFPHERPWAKPPPITPPPRPSIAGSTPVGTSGAIVDVPGRTPTGKTVKQLITPYGTGSAAYAY